MVLIVKKESIFYLSGAKQEREKALSAKTRGIMSNFQLRPPRKISLSWSEKGDRPHGRDPNIEDDKKNSDEP